MKKKSKVILTVVLIVLLVVLLFPARLRYKDGGSICYRAVLYEVTKWHQISETEPDGFRDGFQVKILGMTVFDKYYE